MDCTVRPCLRIKKKGEREKVQELIPSRTPNLVRNLTLHEAYILDTSAVSHPRCEIGVRETLDHYAMDSHMASMAN
jgi:hypothetical protein